MKSRSVVLHALLALVFVAISAVALHYSLATPFRLVDDLGDWLVLKEVGSLDAFLASCKHVLLELHPGRHRPLFEIYNFLVWKAFGPHPAPIHLVRWIVKAMTLALACRALDLLRPKGSSGLSRALPLWLFAFVYWFFPINPEATLAPQELLMALFLAWVNLEVALLLAWRGGDLSDMDRGAQIRFFAASLGLCWSKEICFAYLAGVLGCLGLWQLALRKPRNLLKLAPAALVAAHTLVKVKYAFSGGGYGTAPITLALLKKNAVWSAWSLLSWPTLPRWMTLFYLALPLGAATWLARRAHRGTPPALFFALLAAEAGATFVMACTSWRQTPHYYYPVLLPLVSLLALGWIVAWDRAPLGKRVRTALLAVTPVVCVYYAGYNAYNYVYQFADQYNSGESESRMLDAVEARLATGAPVAVRGDEEMERDVGIYFNEFLPYFEGKRLPILTDPGAAAPYVVTRESRMPAGEDWALDARLVALGSFRALDLLERVSATLQLHPRGRAFVWRDGGASFLEESPSWYIWRRPRS